MLDQNGLGNLKLEFKSRNHAHKKIQEIYQEVLDDLKFYEILEKVKWHDVLKLF